MKRFLFPLCAFAAALVGIGSASASPILSPGLTISSGALTFSSFSCVVTGTGTYGGSCAAIDVAALTPPPAGIQLSASLSVIGQSPSSTADAALGFTVSDPNGISFVGLSFNSIAMGNDVNTVTEDIYTDSTLTTLLGQAVVSCTSSSCTSSTMDSVSLGGTYTSLFITKDVSLIAGAGGSGSTSIITQTFSAPAPEPISISLMGGGLALLGLARLGKKKA